METTSKKLDDNKLEITVTLTADEVQKEIDAAYKQAGKNRIPGFRPGKAPRKVLENHFGGKEYFNATATEELVQSYTPLAPDAMNLVPLSNPDFSEFDLVEEGMPFVFTFSIEVAPELELSSYDPVQIELPSAEPTEEEIQTQIDALLSYNISTDEEGNEQKPELTDAWVKETLEFESVEEFKERLSDSLREQKSQDLPMLREIRSTQELAGRLKGEVPDALIRQTEQDNYRDLFQSLQQQRLTLDAYLEAYGYTSETFRDSMRTQAENSASMALALDALARHLAIVITDEEILEEFERSGAKDPERLYEDWRKNGRLAEIRQGLARMKASQQVIDTAEVFEPGTLHPEDSEGKPAKKAKKAATNKTDKKKDEAAADVPAENAAEKAQVTSAKTAKTAGSKAEKKPAETAKPTAKKEPARKTAKKADDTKK